MSKVHFEMRETSPNESDTEGNYYLGCGREYDNPKVTKYANEVTCRTCQKFIAYGGKLTDSWQ